MSEADVDSGIIAVPCYEQWGTKFSLTLLKVQEIANALNIKNIPRTATKRDICKILNNIQEGKNAQKLAEKLSSLGYVVQWKIERINFDDQAVRNNKTYVKVKWIGRDDETYEPIEKVTANGKALVRPPVIHEVSNVINSEQQSKLEDVSFVAVANSSFGTALLHKNGTELTLLSGDKSITVAIDKSNNVFMGKKGYFYVTDQGPAVEINFATAITNVIVPLSGKKIIKLVPLSERTTLVLLDDGQLLQHDSVTRLLEPLVQNVSNELFIDFDALMSTNDIVALTLQGKPVHFGPSTADYTQHIPTRQLKSVIAASPGIFFGLSTESLVVRWGRRVKDTWQSKTRFRKISNPVGIDLSGDLYDLSGSPVLLPRKDEHKFVAISENYALYDDGTAINWQKTSAEYNEFLENNPDVREDEQKLQEEIKLKTLQNEINQEFREQFQTDIEKLKQGQERIVNVLKQQHLEDREALSKQLDDEFKRKYVFYVPEQFDKGALATELETLQKPLKEQHKKQLADLQSTPTLIGNTALLKQLSNNLLARQTADLKDVKDELIASKNNQLEQKRKEEENKLAAAKVQFEREKRGKLDQLEKSQQQEIANLISNQFSKEYETLSNRHKQQVDEEIKRREATKIEQERLYNQRLERNRQSKQKRKLQQVENSESSQTVLQEQTPQQQVKELSSATVEQTSNILQEQRPVNQQQFKELSSGTVAQTSNTTEILSPEATKQFYEEKIKTPITSQTLQNISNELDRLTRQRELKTDEEQRTQTTGQAKGATRTVVDLTLDSDDAQVSDTIKQPVQTPTMDTVQPKIESKEKTTASNSSDDDVKTEPPLVVPRQNVGLVTDKRMLEHKCPCKTHYENPDRLTVILDALKSFDLIKIASREATDDELATCHDVPAILAQIKTLADAEFKDGDDMYALQGKTLTAARLAAGSSIQLVTDIIDGKVQSGFAAVRPPGHHAHYNSIGGFCFFNNATLAAVHATKLGLRVLIIDFDVHFGDGTENILQSIQRDNKNIACVSIHRFDLFPESPADQQKKVAQVPSRILNIAFSGPRGDRYYLDKFRDEVLPFAKEFKPDLIVVSAGFDAAKGDPLGRSNVTVDGYRKIMWVIKSITPKIAMILEGGYDLIALSESAAACVGVLLENSNE